jgi:hypothetical protein
VAMILTVAETIAVQTHPRRRRRVDARTPLLSLPVGMQAGQWVGSSYYELEAQMVHSGPTTLHTVVHESIVCGALCTCG